MATTRFRYPLDALLRKRQSDWKSVKLEEVTAGRLVETRGTAVDQARGTLEGAEQLLRSARGAGTPIDPAQQLSLGNYLVHQRAALHEHRQALRQAQDLRERVRSNLDGISRGIKSLEKHRAARETNHRLEQDNLEQKRLDEIWLLGRSRGAGSERAKNSWGH